MHCIHAAALGSRVQGCVAAPVRAAHGEHGKGCFEGQEVTLSQQESKTRTARDIAHVVDRFCGEGQPGRRVRGYVALLGQVLGFATYGASR